MLCGIIIFPAAKMQFMTSNKNYTYRKSYEHLNCMANQKFAQM